MMRTLLLGLLGSLSVALTTSDEAGAPSAKGKAAANRGESLADAVVRINAEVERDFGVLSPSLLTETKLKAAIEVAVDKISDSDWTGRTSYAKTLAEIAATGHIPESVTFHLTPITIPADKKQKDEFRDGRHLSISLNYTLLVMSDHGNRLIGLTPLVEIFQVIKPQEQSVPFQPLTVDGRREEKAD